MSLTVRAFATITLDPGDKRVIRFDWDTENLATGVEISSSTWTITVIKQNGLTALTSDNASIVTGNRSTQARFLGTTATAGDQYRVTNQIVTNESPAQQKERSFFVLVQDR